jgi:hypothetical protein
MTFKGREKQHNHEHSRCSDYNSENKAQTQQVQF